MRLRKKAIKNRDGALYIVSAYPSWMTVKLYLKEIFKVSSCQMLHLGWIGQKPLNGSWAKCRSLPVSDDRSQLNHTSDTLSDIIPLIQLMNETQVLHCNDLQQVNERMHSKIWLVIVSKRSGSLTEVSTHNWGFKMCSTAALPTAKFCSWISEQASFMIILLLSSLQERVWCCCLSWGMPIFWIRFLGMRQQGHGQPPKFRTVAISTLEKLESILFEIQIEHTYFSG